MHVSCCGLPLPAMKAFRCLETYHFPQLRIPEPHWHETHSRHSQDNLYKRSLSDPRGNKTGAERRPIVPDKQAEMVLLDPKPASDIPFTFTLWAHSGYAKSRVLQLPSPGWWDASRASVRKLCGSELLAFSGARLGLQYRFH